MNQPRTDWEEDAEAGEAKDRGLRAYFGHPGSRYGAALTGVVLLVGSAAYSLFGGDDLPPPRQIHEITIVNITPPPPPPPPPPEQKMIEQPVEAEQKFMEEKPLEKPLEKEPVKEAKNEEPPGPLALDAKATGPGDSFNLGSKVGGSPLGGGGGGGSRWGWYASQVQAQMESALRGNNKTRNAIMQVRIRLWAESTGRVSRVQLVSSTGDAELDSAIRDELARLTLREPPPKDMPMPIDTRVTARRPT
ncbi:MULTISPECIES: TonB family protein [unclassified Bradyrhizobium]|uniref:energy transducer TonB family protein n=1 Tax=unclassified Bradyrhizobium TaxID=2631580 RepID=UPI0028F0977E|nr:MULTISPECIES: TonB family protein [unclassified Bradyrhizobium]